MDQAPPKDTMLRKSMSQADIDRTNPVALRTKSRGPSEVNRTEASLLTMIVVNLSLYHEHGNQGLGFLIQSMDNGPCRPQSVNFPAVRQSHGFWTEWLLKSTA